MSKKQNSNDAHAKYGPSSAKNRFICAGWQNISGSNPASEEGDRLHMVCEHNGDEQAAAADYVKRKGKPWIELNQEQWEYVHNALSYVASLPRLGDPHKEVRIDLRQLGMEGMDFGTADLLQFETVTRIHLVDYKFGWGDIDPVEENHQFIIYALGVLQNYVGVQEVVVHMVQPKQNIVDTCEYTRGQFEELLKIEQDAHKKVLQFEAIKDVSLLNAEPLNCERCNRQAQCPLWHNEVLATATQASLFPAEDPKAIIDPKMIPEYLSKGWDVEKADPVRVAQFLSIIPALEKFLSKFKAYALDVHQMKDIPGYSVVESPGRSEVLSPLDTLDLVSQRFGLPRDEVVGAFKPSLTELKELVSSRAPKGEKGKWAEAVVETLSDAGLLTRSPGYSYLKKQATKKLKN